MYTNNSLSISFQLIASTLKYYPFCPGTDSMSISVPLGAHIQQSVCFSNGWGGGASGEKGGPVSNSASSTNSSVVFGINSKINFHERKHCGTTGRLTWTEIKTSSLTCFDKWQQQLIHGINILHICCCTHFKMIIMRGERKNPKNLITFPIKTDWDRIKSSMLWYEKDTSENKSHHGERTEENL